MVLAFTVFGFVKFLWKTSFLVKTDGFGYLQPCQDFTCSFQPLQTAFDGFCKFQL